MQFAIQLVRVVCVVGWLWPAFASSVRAQAEADEAAQSPAYRNAIHQALDEFRMGDFEEARALFAKAHALDPNARTLRGLGMVEFELRNYRASAQYLDEALHSRARPLKGELRTTTETLLQRAREFLAELSLDVDPSSAEVRLDGVPIGWHPGTPIVVQVGDHVLEAYSRGRRPEKRELHIQGGEHLRLALALPEAGTGPALSETPRAASVDHPAGVDADANAASARGHGPWPWVLVGVSGAALVGGGILLALAAHDVSRVEGAKVGTRWSAVSNAYDASQPRSIAGFVLLGVGAAGVAAGIAWLVSGRAHDSGSRAELELGPGSLHVRGTFE